MNVKEVLGAFLLVNNPIVLSEEETKDVQKAIKQLQQENKILKENAENNDKVVDKINWENQLLKKENKQLKEKNEDLELNWEIIRQYCLDEQIPEETDEYNSYIEFSNSVYDNILNKIQGLEQGSDE